jgi:hypothetical protein
MDPRYEWRIWADDLSDVGARIRASASADDRRGGRETYIASIETTATNAKIRDGMLDIKVLQSADRGFEQWVPLDKRPFPITGRVTSDLVSRLGITTVVDRTQYTWSRLLEEIIVPMPQLAAVEVTKDRRLFTHAGCIVEFADVTVAGTRVQTAAVESADLAVLSRLSESLGMTRAPNVNYPRMIHRVLGWVDREE